MVYICALKISFLFFIFMLLIKNMLYITLILHILLQEICHRDLKLENTLLDGSPAPRVKICDFGFSKVNSIKMNFFFIK